MTRAIAAFSAWVLVIAGAARCGSSGPSVTLQVDPPSDNSCIGVAGFVHQHDELRDLTQPGEPRVAKHELEILAGGGDAGDVAFVGGAFDVEERLMEMQQACAESGEAILGATGHFDHGTANLWGIS